MPLVDPVLLRLWGRLAGWVEAPPRLVRLLAREAPAWSDRQAHMHDIPTLIACLEGVVRVGTATGNLDLPAGTVLAVAPGAWHRHDPLRRGCATYGQGLTLKGSDVVLTDHEHRGAYVTIPHEPSAGLLRILVGEDDEDARRCAFRTLLTTVLDSPNQGSGFTDPGVAAMHGTLWHGLGRQLRARDILATAGCSHRQAHRRFVAWFGETPKQAVLRRKLALARQFLDEGGSVTEAAEAAGFRRRADLTRAWRKAFGAPPTRRASADAPAPGSRR